MNLDRKKHLPGRRERVRSTVIVHIKSTVPEIIVPVCFGDFSDDSAWVSDCDHIVRNVPGHDASRADDHIVTDRYPRQDAGAAAYPDVISDGNVDPVFVTRIPGIGMNRMTGSIDGNIGAIWAFAPIRTLPTSRTVKI